MAKFIDEKAIMEKNVARANKQGPLKKSASMFVYIVVLIVAVAARLLQLSTNFNFETGKYKDKSIFLNFPLAVIIIGLAIIGFILLTGNARDKVIKSVILINPWRLRYDKLAKKIPDGAGYAALFMAVIQLSAIFVDFYKIIQKNKETKQELINSGVLTTVQAKDYNMLQGYNAGILFHHILIIFVALTFISIGVNIFKEIGITHANCAALSTYAIWQIVHLLKMISENSMVALSTNRLYEMVSRMLAVLFFLEVAKVFNGMEKTQDRFWMCFLGYASSIIAAVSVIPRYILFVIPDPQETHYGLELPDITDVGIIFMTITMVGVFWTTYVYRQMPRLAEGNRRWTRAPLTKTYEEMKSIEDEMDFIEKQEI